MMRSTANLTIPEQVTVTDPAPTIGHRVFRADRGGLLRDSRLIFMRCAREGRRSPLFAYVFPTLFPLCVIIFASQSYGRIADVPGFPVRPYVAYLAPAALFLAAMMGAGYSATGLVMDIQNGFFDRLRLQPIKPAALLIGRLLFEMVRIFPAGIVILTVSVALGTHVAFGVVGAAGILALCALWSVAYSGVFYVIALKTKNAQAAFSLAPLSMPLMFMSPAFVPIAFLPHWLASVSAWNPYTYMVEGTRPLLSGQFRWLPIEKAVIAALVVLIVTQLLSVRSYAGLVRGD